MGGGLKDEFTSCAIDDDGNLFLSGSTQSMSNIATAGSHQSTHGGGAIPPGGGGGTYDAFLVKFNANGVRQWGTYYGGSNAVGGIHQDWGNSCAVDNNGNVFLVGQTNDTFGLDVIATLGAHQTMLTAYKEGFVVKFDGDGVRQWGTYYGGEGEDLISSCITDKNGNLLFLGRSNSSTGIAAAGSHQSTLNGNEDGFVVKFDGDGVRQWGSYYGGEGGQGLGEALTSCAIDNNGNLFMCGLTNSESGIATAGAHRTTFGGGTLDGFLVKFSECSIAVSIENVVNVSVNNGNDGSATASVTGVTGSVTYTWSNGDTTATASALTSGSYTVTAIDAKGCAASATVEIIFLDSLAAIMDNESLSEQINLFPNPTRDKVFISLKDGQLEGSEVRVYSNAGRMVLSESNVTLNQSNYEVNLSSFSAGQYNIIISSGGKSNQYKVILN